jgi:hypothetical protein
MRTVRGKIGWGVMAFLAVGISLAVVPQYLTADETRMFPQQVETYLANLTPIVGHVAGGAVALLLGPTQFIPALRRRRSLAFHRWAGRLYLVGIAVGGFFGLWMAFLAYGGFVAQAGFFGLSVAWLVSGAIAYRLIRAADQDHHREWMIRNYALTFAAVTLRLWLGVSQASGIDFDLAYPAIAWIAWVPNLIVVEWWIRRRRNPDTARREAVPA